MTQIIGYKPSVKARKPHKCWWCGEAINPGDVYARWVDFDLGHACTIRCHPECEATWGTLDEVDSLRGFAECARGCTCENGACECGALKGN